MLLYLVTGGTMIYGDVPVTIPILAAGYLLTVYLLLVLAQRNTKGAGSDVVSPANKRRSEGVRG